LRRAIWRLRVPSLGSLWKSVKGPLRGVGLGCGAALPFPSLASHSVQVKGELPVKDPKVGTECLVSVNLFHLGHPLSWRTYSTYLLSREGQGHDFSHLHHAVVPYHEAEAFCQGRCPLSHHGVPPHNGVFQSLNPLYAAILQKHHMLH